MRWRKWICRRKKEGREESVSKRSAHMHLFLRIGRENRKLTAWELTYLLEDIGKAPKKELNDNCFHKRYTKKRFGKVPFSWVVSKGCSGPTLIFGAIDDSRAKFLRRSYKSICLYILRVRSVFLKPLGGTFIQLWASFTHVLVWF